MKRYAAVGTGSRVPMYIDPLVLDYKNEGELVALCDSSRTRMTYHRDRLVTDHGYHVVPTYTAADFEQMVRETRPDVVIVCSMDSTHHEYIIKALQFGCDVVTEKPMTTGEESAAPSWPQCRRPAQSSGDFQLSMVARRYQSSRTHRAGRYRQCKSR